MKQKGGYAYKYISITKDDLRHLELGNPITLSFNCNLGKRIHHILLMVEE